MVLQNQDVLRKLPLESILYYIHSILTAEFLPMFRTFFKKKSVPQHYSHQWTSKKPSCYTLRTWTWYTDACIAKSTLKPRERNSRDWRNKHRYTIMLWTTELVSGFLFQNSKLWQMLVSDNCQHPLTLTHFILLATSSFWLGKNISILFLSRL